MSQQLEQAPGRCCHYPGPPAVPLIDGWFDQLFLSAGRQHAGPRDYCRASNPTHPPIETQDQLCAAFGSGLTKQTTLFQFNNKIAKKGTVVKSGTYTGPF
jgi:hypothetical protein